MKGNRMIGKQKRWLTKRDKDQIRTMSEKKGKQTEK